MTKKEVYLKDRFLRAVVMGELGTREEAGIVVTLKEFKLYFSDIKSQYRSSFLAASTIEKGRVSCTHTQFVFRVRKGVYLVHPEVYAQYEKLLVWEKSQEDAGNDHAIEDGD